MRIKPAGRLLAFVLTLSMLLGMVPTALADELAPPAPTQDTEEGAPSTGETRPVEEAPPSEETSAADNALAELAAEGAPAELAAGTTSLTAGVKDYSSSDKWYWEVANAKTLDLRVDVPTTSEGQEYKIRVTLAPGMRFQFFPWNEDWGTAPAGVLGNKVDMTAAMMDLLKGQSLTGDVGQKAELTYTLKSSTTSINLNGQISVIPDGRMIRDNVDIADAVKIELLNHEDTVLHESKTTVKTGTTQRPTVNAGSITLVAGVGYRDYSQNLFSQYTWMYDSNSSGIYYCGVKTVIPLPACVTDAKVKDSELFASTFADHTLTIEAKKPFLNGGNSFTSTILISVDASTPAGEYTADAPVEVTRTFLHGDPKTEMYTSSNCIKITMTEADPQLIVKPRHQTQRNPIDPDAVFQLGDNGRFQTRNDLPDNQRITFDFSNPAAPDQVLDVVQVGFPVKNDAGAVIENVAVTFDDGETITIPQMRKVKPGDTTIDVSFATLKDYIADLSGKKYIRAATADCGTFPANYYQWSEYRTLSARFSKEAEEAAAKGDKVVVPYTITVNGVSTTSQTTCSPEKSYEVNFHVGSVTPTTIAAGGTTEVYAYMRGFGDVRNPEFYMVLPKGLSLSPGTAVLKEEGGGITGSQTATLEVTQLTGIRDESGKEYNAYRFVGKDTMLTTTQPDGTVVNRILRLTFKVTAEETMEAQTIDLKDFAFLTGPSAGQTVQNGAVADRFDLDGDGDRTERLAMPLPSTKLTIVEQKNITLQTAFVTSSGANSGSYDPGVDGSTNVNAVPFAPGASADLHVQIKNTNDAASGDSIKAYIPIPKTTVSGATVTPQNISSSGSRDSRYQFNDFQWNMNLNALVQNPDTTLYDITYYTGSIATDANGEPSTYTSKHANPSSTSDITGGLNAVSMVGITVKAGKTIPLKNGPLAYTAEFVVPLTVGTTEDEANTADLNGKKNIFRPWFYRSSNAGAGYTSGNYAAPLLSAAIIEGRVFEDETTNGLNDRNTPVKEVKLKLTSQDGTVTHDAKTDAEGKYKFSGLQPGAYTVEAENPSTATYHFTKNITAAGEYKRNSDGVPSADHGKATVSVALPAPSGQPVDYNSYIDFGLVKQIKVELQNTTGGTLENADAQTIWPGSKVTPLTATPDAGYAFGRYSVDGTTVDLNTRTFDAPATVVAHWTAQPQTLTLNANGGKYPLDANTKTLQVPTNTILKSYLDDAANRPSRAGYTFTGWAADADGAALTHTAMPAGGLTVYAKWEAAEVTLTFDPAGGTFASGSNASMTVQAESLFTPPTVSKENSTFEGWYTDLDVESTKLPDNPKAPTANTIYYAKWAGYNVSGRVFLDRNYNGVYTAGNAEDQPLSGITVTLKKADDTLVATTRTDANGSFILDAKAAGSYYLEVGTALSTPAAKLIAKKTGGSVIDPGTGKSEAFAVNNGGVSGMNVGYAEPVSFKLYSDAARKNEVTAGTELKLQTGQTSNLYYTMSPSYLASTAPHIVPNIGGTAHVSAVHASYGIISLTGVQFTDSTSPSSLTAKVDDGFRTDVDQPFKALVLPPQVVAQFEDNLNFYTQVKYQKDELLGGITLQNQIYDGTDLMDESKGATPFHPVAVWKLDANGNRDRDLSGELAGDTKVFDGGYIGKYEMVFSGTDVYGRPVVDANGKSEIVRTVYIHGYPYLTQTAPIQSRLNAGYNPMMEQDGSTYITATHQHVYTKADGTIETRADETFSAAPAKLEITLLGYYPYDKDGDDFVNGKFKAIDLTKQEEQAKLLTAMPTEAGAYEVFYTVRMGTRQAVLQVHRTLYLHGSPSMYVPTVIAIPPQSGDNVPEYMDLDYAAEKVWSNALLDMHDLIHVRENGSTVTYDRVHTQFYKQNGDTLTIAGTGQTIDGWSVTAAPTQWRGGVVNQGYGGSNRPANTFLKADSLNVLKNTPGVYDVTVVFQDTIDGMGSKGDPNGWIANWDALFREGGMGYAEMKVKVVVTSEDAKPVLPGQDQLVTNFVLGDSTWFSRLTDFDDKTLDAIETTYGADTRAKLKQLITDGVVAPMAYENWVRYYQAEPAQITTPTTGSGDPFANKTGVSLLELLTQAIRYKTHDVDIHALKDQGGYKDLHEAAVTLLWKSVKLTQIRVPVLGQDEDQIIQNPTNAELMAILAKNQPGTLEATFSVANVKVADDQAVTDAGTLGTAAQDGVNSVSGYKYKLTLEPENTVTETYKVYVHSDLVFERPNGAPLVTYGLHIPSSQSHTSMPLRAYFVGAKALQKNYYPTASVNPDISKAGSYINMDYSFTHPIQGILPTLREKTVHYYGRAFVNDDVKLLYNGGASLPSSIHHVAGSGAVDILSGFAAQVDKWTGLPADDALAGRNDHYPPVNGSPADPDENIVTSGGAKYETGQSANLKIYEGGTLLYDSADPAAGRTLDGNAPGRHVLTYVAEDEGTDANHPYHNGPNRKSAAVAYIIDGPVTVRFGPNVTQTTDPDGTTAYTVKALETVTDDELTALLGANASVVYGDDTHLRPSGVEVKYQVVRDGGDKPTSVRVSAEARNGNKAEAVVLVTALKPPVIQIKLVDKDGKAIGTPPAPVTDAVIGQPYTVFAPHVEGYTLDGDAAQVIASVKEGKNEVTFRYIKVEPDANLATYTITYQLNDADKTQLMSGSWRELVGETIEHEAPAHYYKEGLRYTLALATGETNPNSIKLTKAGPNELTFTYKADPEPVQVQYTVRYLYANADGSTGVAETHTLVGNVGQTVTANAPGSFSRDGFQYTLKDPSSKTFKLTDDATKNIIDFTYSQTAISSGGGGGGGGGGGSTVKYYALAFEVNGGSAIQAVTEQSGKTVKLDSYKPTRKGYTFTGWFADSALKKPVTEVKLNDNKVVYAGWEKSDEQPDTGVTGGTTVSDTLITDDHFAYVQGTEGRFDPTRNMTRAETAMIFYRLLKDKDVPVTAGFSDVPASEWYAQAVNTLASLKVITGYTDGTFKPNGTISRAEFVTIATRFVGLTDENPSFTDVPSDYWAYHYIATAVSLGWVNGYPDGSFQPARTITRAEAVKIVNRMLGRKPDQAAIDKLDAPYSDLGKDNWAYYEILEASVAHDHKSDEHSGETWTKQK